MPSNRLLVVVLAFFFLFSWIYDDVTVPNERSRVYLTVSLVDCGEISIDCAVKRFGPINDWARVGDHYFTDKAPGSSLLGTLPYLVARLFSSPDDWTIVELVNLQRRLLMIPLSILGALLLRRSLRVLAVSDTASMAAIIAWLLGSVSFHYSSAFYGHQIVAVALLAAIHFGLIAEWRTGVTRPSLWSGMACGLAGLVEYQAIPLALIVAVGVAHRAIREGSAIDLAHFVLGALPWSAMFMVYHALAFGGPFSLSYSHLVSAAIQAKHTRGIGGVGLPRWHSMAGLLFSPNRGLLVTSPVLILLPVGLLRLGRRLSWIVATAVFVCFFVAAGADAWAGGWSFGPRLLVPVMGIAMIPLAMSIDRLREGPQARWIGGAIWGFIAFGVLYNQLAQAVFPELPEDALNPLKDVFAPMLAKGHLTPNVMSTLFRERSLWTLLPICVGTAGILLWLGHILRPHRGPGGVTRRSQLWGIWLAASMMVLGAGAAYLLARSPAWNDSQQRDWRKVVEHWEKMEQKH
ncbi:MAG: hypothetical protein H6716_26680 [Polyangiaceae bacterium]|nr:hypothetical protein [Polyangiaceae bacterium]